MIEVLYFVAIFVSALALGKRIVDMLKLNLGFIENIVFSSAIGFGVLSYITLFIGLAGLLYKSIFLVLIMLILALSIKELKYFAGGIKNLMKGIKKLKVGINLILIIIFCIFILANLIASLSPPYLWDEVTYNIALPKIYASHHQIIPVYDEFRSNYPFNINMLFTLGMVIGNAELSKLFMFGYGTLLALAIFAFAKKYFSLRSALLAALIYYTIPMISNHISSTYTDIGVAFYIFTAYFAFYRWFETGRLNWLFLSSIMAGMSIASKHTALAYMPVLALGIAYKLFFMEREKFLRASGKILCYGLIALLLASPWYIKSYIYTGNPVFPYANTLFDAKYLDKIQSQNLLNSNYLDSAEPRTFISFFLKPWDLTMHSSNYGMLLGFGPVFLAFIPLIFLFRKVNPALKYLLVFSAIPFVIWFFSPQVLRYLMVYPMLSIVSGEVADKLIGIKKLKVVIMLVLLSSLLFNIALWYGANKIKVPYAFGLESEQSFYLKLKDNNGYNVFKYANENLPKASKLLLFREPRGYLSNLDYINGDPLTQKVLDYSQITNAGDMRKELGKLGITHVLINTKIEFFGIHNPNQPPRYSEKILKLMDETLQSRGKLLFSENRVYLYELNMS